MNYSITDFLTLIGSVCLFLYGMKIMSEGLQKVAGDRLRNILSIMTKNRVTGVMTGIVITALIQSSSASTVMVVSFVNAGLMSLSQSMAVIMGANIGTTFTAWIISLFGFKMKISAFALPLIGFAVPMMFSSSSKYKSIGEFLLGFAFLFIGLDKIGTSVPELSADNVAFLQGYAQSGFLSVLIFVFAGLVITALIQSSAATFAIVLVMCAEGWIPFDMGCALVLGSNIGTTITPILASMSGNVASKKAALGHFLFNLFGSVWTVILFFPFCKLIGHIIVFLGNQDPMTMSDPKAMNPEQLEMFKGAVAFGLSMFHTVFNIINLFIMIWFCDTYVKITNFLIRSHNKEEEEFQLRFISRGLLSASELNIAQAQREIVVYGERVERMFGMVKELVHTKNGTPEFNKLFSRIEKYEEISDRMEVEIAKYLNQVVDGRLSIDSKLRIAGMLNMISEIESVADGCYNIGRTLVRKEEGHAHFDKDSYANIDTMLGYVGEALTNMLVILRADENVRESDFMVSVNKEREINNLRNMLRVENLENINQKKYEYADGTIYMDVICEAEKIGDYIINVVETAQEHSTLHRVNDLEAAH